MLGEATSNIYSYILRENYHYFANHVKGPLVSSLVKLCNLPKGLGFLDKLRLLRDIWAIVRSVYRYPEPTKENTKKHISHVLLDLWDEFFRQDTGERQQELFRAIKRISVSECEHDGYYSQRMSWFLMKLTEKYMSGEWTPLEPWCPAECWGDAEHQKRLLVALLEFNKSGTINGKSVFEIEA